MSVILFKAGISQKFDEYTFVDRLKEGWCLSEDEASNAEATAPKAVVVDTDDKKEKAPEYMDKKELEIYARSFGIELDRRKSLRNMLKKFNQAKG